MGQDEIKERAWFRLAPDIHIVPETDGWNLISERGALVIGGAPVQVGAILTALQRGAWLRDLAALGSVPVLGRILLQLRERGWLVHERDADVPAQFRQVTGWMASRTATPVSALAALERATVAIIGLGGLGSQIAEHLAGAGVGGFVLIDGDRVDASNLNRQYMFDHGAIGRRKVDVAQSRIAARSPSASVVSRALFTRSIEDLSCLDSQPVQLVINCADQPRNIDALVASYCERRGVPFVTSGAGLHRGYWGPFLPDRQRQGLDACEARLRALQGSTIAGWDKARICTSSHGPYNSIIAGHVASDVIVHLGNIAEPKSLRRRLYMDFDQLTITPVPADAGGMPGAAKDRE